MDYVDPSGEISIPNPFQPLEEAAEGANEIGDLACPGKLFEIVNPAKRYEELNNTIECVAELGLGIPVEGRCNPGEEESHPAEEPPSEPDDPLGPPPTGPRIPPRGRGTDKGPGVTSR